MTVSSLPLPKLTHTQLDFEYDKGFPNFLPSHFIAVGTLALTSSLLSGILISICDHFSACFAKCPQPRFHPLPRVLEPVLFSP